MPFKYCIAIDVEKTTEGPEIAKEIIEFAAVAFDLSKNLVLDEFHSFVKPEHKTILSDFCKNLTGITQETITKSKKIRTLIERIMRWLRILKDRHGVRPLTKGNDANCCIITWSENDMRSIHYDLRAKNMSCPKVLCIGFDLQPTFAKLYAQNEIVNLERAVEKVGLVFQGKAHSAKHDALNLALLAGHMAKDKGTLLSSNHVMYLKEI